MKIWVKNGYGAKSYNLYDNEARGYSSKRKKQKRKENDLYASQKLVKKFLFVMQGSTYRKKIHDLIGLSQLKMKAKLSYEVRRKRSHKAYGPCRLCHIRMAEVRHHMIQIQNGGPDKGWNRINICNVCHEEIHPWMKTGRALKEMDSKFLATTREA